MVNKISLVFVITLCLVASSCKNEKRFKVRGILSNSKNEVLILKEMTTVDHILVDSIKVNSKGEFKLRGKSSRPAFYMLSISSNNYVVLIIHPGENLFIKANAESLANSYFVGGSRDSELARKLNDQINKALKKVNKLHDTYMDSLGTKNILVTRQMLDTMYKHLETDYRKFSISFINENINSLAAIMALYQELSPRRQLFNINDDYYLFRKVDSVMQKLFPEADMVKSLHTLVQDASEEQARRIEMEKKLSVGTYAPEISLKGPFGNDIKLTSLRGKYVLIDFWASWKEESANDLQYLVRFYWRYRHNGFDIYQVSLDTNKELWLNSITNYGLPWSNVCDFKKYDSPVIKLYNVNDIPTRLLIDPNGRIIAKHLDINELSNKLKDIFKY